MKKAFIIGSIILTSLTACNNEHLVGNSFEANKSPAVVNFEKAIKSLGSSQNRETIEEQQLRGTSTELSDRRKEILIPSALELIKSTGARESEIRKETGYNRDKILTWAVKIYNQKLNKLSQKP